MQKKWKKIKNPEKYICKKGRKYVSKNMEQQKYKKKDAKKAGVYVKNISNSLTLI